VVGMKKKILVVDDEKDILELLSYNLTKEGFEVITARNGIEALELAKKGPDLIILDIMMPEMNGIEVIRELAKDAKTASIPIILLTAKGSETDEIVGLEIGADDYIVKPVKIGKLIARVNACLRRKEIFEKSAIEKSNVLKYKELEVDVDSYVVKINDKRINLARKEFETLVYLMRNKGKVMSRNSILDTVWGENVHVVDRTVDVHIRKIREKLGKYADCIETVPGVGYRFTEPNE